MEELRADGIAVNTVAKVGSVFNRRGGRGTRWSDQRRGESPRRASRWSTSAAGSSSPTWWRPTRSTATARTSRASIARCRGSMPRWGSGGRGWTPCATSSSSPPTMDATSPRPARTTPASTPRCSRSSLPTVARRHDGPLADVGASVLRWLAGRGAPALPGTHFTCSNPSRSRAAIGAPAWFVGGAGQWRGSHGELLAVARGIGAPSRFVGGTGRRRGSRDRVAVPAAISRRSHDRARVQAGTWRAVHAIGLGCLGS